MNPYICPATIKAHVLETWLEIQACNTRTYWPNETAISSKGHEPDNIVSHNSLKLSFANIQGLLSNFKSFLKSNTTDNLGLYETNLDDSIDF